jgi:hypothetical protein
MIYECGAAVPNFVNDVGYQSVDSVINQIPRYRGSIATNTFSKNWGQEEAQL